MKVTLDELVFENRNREYGAYYLRKNYKSYLTRATLIGSAVFCLLIGGSFAFSKVRQDIQNKDFIVDLSPTDLRDVEDPVIEIPEELPPPPLEEPLPELAQEKFLPPEPKRDEEVHIEEPPPPTEKLETAIISGETVAGVEVKDVFIPLPLPKEAGVVKVEVPKEEEIFIGVEQDPEFPGGITQLYQFLGNSVRYPVAAQRANISGKVTVQFVVERDGSIGAVKVLKGIGFGCDEEAIRVIKSMPKWNPGKQNGRAVRVYYTIPVAYKLSD